MTYLNLVVYIFVSYRAFAFIVQFPPYNVTKNNRSTKVIREVAKNIFRRNILSESLQEHLWTCEHLWAPVNLITPINDDSSELST